MRVSIHFGGGRNRRKEKRVPRNHNYSHYRGGSSGGGSSTVITSPKGKFFLGLVLFAIATLVGFLVFNDANKTKDYIETSGYVIDYYDKWDSSSNNYLYSEIVEYKVDGKIYECVSSSSSSVPLPFGSRVSVYYNPVNPSVAVVNKKSSNVIAYVICGVMGAAGLFVMFLGIKGFVTGDSKE